MQQNTQYICEYIWIDGTTNLRSKVKIYQSLLDANDMDNEENLKQIEINYNYFGQGLFTHATPTLFNAGTQKQQMSSCYLMGTNDSIEGIFKTVTDCAHISKWAGGIGIHISNIRSRGQLIKKTNGKSSGIVPMMKLLNETGRFVNQGGKRNGSIAIYIEPWHSDILEFLELRKNGGKEEDKCRDLFLALTIPDRFMRAVENDEKWYLMSQDDCPGLSDVYGEEFDELYQSYIDQKKYVSEINASRVWQKIMTSQMETGTPYIIYKDHINKKSNQQNLGTIKSSNLCSEIVEYSNDNEYAVCNLASLAVNKCYNSDTKKYDYELLHTIAKQATYNLNKIIDINYYPVPETECSNLKHRPIGVGIQGFADLLFMMKIQYDSDAALNLSGDLLETIYHGTMEASHELAIKYGPYSSFIGSPISQGKFQFDLWNKKSNDRYDWATLRQQIIKYGVRNSLTVALMPTATTSQILGNIECFEPITSNLYSRLTLAGNFIILNKYLQQDLMMLDLWNEDIQKQITVNYGSIQNIDKIPQTIKDIYKTVWEIKQKYVIDHAIRRGPFVDQSQSMNLYFAVPDSVKLRNALFYGWKNGIKTGIYYLRSQPSANPQQTFTKEKTCDMCAS
jgi:ribonucleoside-diphosphate reductase alpha subunit